MRDADYKFLSQMIKINKLNDVINHIDKVKIIKGDAVKTIPNYIKKNTSCLIRLYILIVLFTNLP